MYQATDELFIFDALMDFKTLRIVREATITIHTGREKAFPLLTPAYESLWLPSFQPVFIDGAEPQYAGKIFLTRHKDASVQHPVLWVMTSYSPESGTVEYTRFTPASDVTVIRIRAAESAKGTTTVTVRYEINGLTDRGNAFAHEMNETAFAAWIGGWESAINEYLERKRDGAYHRAIR